MAWWQLWSQWCHQLQLSPNPQIDDRMQIERKRRRQTASVSSCCFRFQRSVFGWLSFDLLFGSLWHCSFVEKCLYLFNIAEPVSFIIGQTYVYIEHGHDANVSSLLAIFAQVTSAVHVLIFANNLLKLFSCRRVCVCYYSEGERW